MTQDFKRKSLGDNYKYRKKIRAVNRDGETHLFRNENCSERRLLRKTVKGAEHVRSHRGKYPLGKLWGERKVKDSEKKLLEK